MPEPITFEQYIITPVDTEQEVNFVVSDPNGYVCRLVPGEAGFEISKADKAVGNEIPLELVSRLSDFIERQNA